MTRTLVTYASKHGSTAQIAAVIAETLRDAGLEVDLRPAGQVRDVAGVDAVVVGSAVYMNKWQGPAIDILRLLERNPGPQVWMFSSGPTGGTPESDAKAAQMLATQPPAPGDAGKRGVKLGAQGHVTFGGRITEDMGGFFERWMPRGDWRDFSAIEAWAVEIAGELEPAAA